jgi:pyruvate kinase
MIEFGIRRGHELGYLQKGDVVVVTAGIHQRTGSTNMIRVVTADA